MSGSIQCIISKIEPSASTINVEQQDNQSKITTNSDLSSYNSLKTSSENDFYFLSTSTADTVATM